MKMIVIIMTIMVFFVVESLGLNLLLKDTLVTTIDQEGNQSTQLFDTSDVNMSVLESNEETTLRTFPNALKIMFTFRTPQAIGIPSFLTLIISIINWFLILMFGVAVYRIVNPFAGQ